MRAMLAHQPVIASLVSIDDQLLAKNFHRTDRFFLSQFRGSRHGVPIPAQQLTAGSATADLSQQFIFFTGQHRLNFVIGGAACCAPIFFSAFARSRAFPTLPNPNSLCESHPPSLALSDKSLRPRRSLPVLSL